MFSTHVSGLSVAFFNNIESYPFFRLRQLSLISFRRIEAKSAFFNPIMLNTLFPNDAQVTDPHNINTINNKSFLPFNGLTAKAVSLRIGILDEEKWEIWYKQFFLFKFSELRRSFTIFCGNYLKCDILRLSNRASSDSVLELIFTGGQRIGRLELGQSPRGCSESFFNRIIDVSYFYILFLHWILFSMQHRLAIQKKWCDNSYVCRSKRLF